MAQMGKLENREANLEDFPVICLNNAWKNAERIAQEERV
jgi:hypothetical protein